MARKFNIGRQSEHILNKEMHDIFMSMKYLNSGNTVPRKDEQADIPNGALWLENYFNKTMLNAYNENARTWNPIFEGHYHPADVFTKPANPVNGQLWIDHSNGDLLHYYDSNTSSWVAVSALSSEKDGNIGAYNNFIIIDPFNPSLGNAYLVPNEIDGRLYDGKKYIHPSDSSYTKLSSSSIEYISKYNENETWVHVNHKNISQVDKRLIKVVTDLTDEYAYTVELFDHNTEFYGIDSATGVGKLLLPNYEDPSAGDYIKTDYGIKLLTTEYEYIYAITYSFGTYNKRPGRIVRNCGTVSTQDTVYVGPCTEHAFVFLDGLYLEQDKYTHNRETNSIIITGDDITQLMDLTAITFPDYSKQSDNITPLEFRINQTNGIATIHRSDSEEAIKLPRKTERYSLERHDAVVGPLTNAKSFVKPMAFVGGIHADITAEPKDVVIEGDVAIIKNIGPMEDGDSFKVMIVEGNGVYVGCGTVTKDKTIRHEGITTDDDYMLYIDGILVSPRDVDISPGEIRVVGLMEGQAWTLLKANESNNTAIIFDSAVSHFSIKIEDSNEATIYNDCDAAIVFCGEGALVDRDCVIISSLPKRGINGQIVAIDNYDLADGSVEHPPADEEARQIPAAIMYFQWSRKFNKWIDVTSSMISNSAIINVINGYITSRGSISILNKNVVNKPYTYYAYSFINTVDEPLDFGYRFTQEGILDYKVNVRHDYIPETGSLIAYLNGLRIYPTEKDRGVFTLDEIESISTTTWDEKDVSSEFAEKDNALDNGLLTYLIERPEANESVSYNRVTLTPADRVEGHVNTYKTTLPLLPGYVTVYVNGVRLPREEFSIANETTIVLYRDVVGGQSVNIIDDPSTWNLFSINTPGGPKIIECETYDIIEVEVRQDFLMKEITLPVRYAGQTVFNTEDDGLPKSILGSKDFVKVFINGIFYGNELDINEDSGYISLTNSHALTNLGIDPIDVYFRNNPKAHDEYQIKHGKPYIAQRPQDYITFEWR